MPGGGGGSKFIYVVVAFATLGGIMFGLDQGNWGGAIVKRPFIKVFCVDKNPEVEDVADKCKDAKTVPSSYVRFLGFGSSFLQAGAAVGALLLAPIIAGRLGRREAMVAGSLVTIVGVLPQMFLTNVPLFLCVRFFAGLGIGIVTYALPMFISEIAPANIRGALGASMQLTTTIGSLIASILNLAPWFKYQFSFSLPVYPAIIVALFIFCFPMSPRFAILKFTRRGEPEEGANRAFASLRRLRGDDEVARMEVEELKQSLAYEADEAPWSVLLKDPSLRRRLILANGLQWLQQFTGVNAILTYGPSLFKSAGVPLDELLCAVITNCFNTTGTLVMLVLIDKFGRRFLLLLGAAASSFFMGLSALLAHLIAVTPQGQPHREAYGWGLLFAVCGYMASFAIGWGGVPWVYPSEIFPMDVKEKALATSTFSQWAANFLIAYLIPLQVSVLKPMGTFLFYCICMAIAFVVVFFFFPETAKKSLEEMDQIFGARLTQARDVGSHHGSLAGEPETCACSLVPQDTHHRSETELAESFSSHPSSQSQSRRATTRVILNSMGAAALT
mmetsp:Transcript_132149/g.410663  ORF Transcript_132149/g.410663 Transcript_132149/m.410663 type:complete len:559 (-) Transcript_132149:490-2166(-)|eukprot:CAMPEP_0204585926 /NCGR_PEP_ID=MMETSP0661-20131031/47194_1 /ASSEMBLY_ACC=CAM_ASM_000606 /TAXON_ID=109239 /ORGANISM="Alexandrium margalefi, Strain AMGDE01CS-322" /LENGTH=558 /DNA_ID=CAMNT_0051595521 /DNA_START=30 /DNA_END=1706 /DNA_ORIENTATION=-